MVKNERQRLSRCGSEGAYSARHHKLPINSYRRRAPMFRCAIVQPVPNYGEFPAGSESGFRLVTYGSQQKLQPFK